MGGKKISGRSSSGETRQSRVSSAVSTKSSPNESTPTASYFHRIVDASTVRNEMNPNPETASKSSVPQRKNSFDIISLLENQEDSLMLASGNENFASRTEKPSELPSFWHFVEPDLKSQGMFYPSVHHRHHSNKTSDQNSILPTLTKTATGDGMPVNKSVNPKRVVRRRKVKKVQSAKVSGFKALERNSERLRKDGREWLRVLTPPGTGSSCRDSANNDSEEDELIRRYFSGLSSAGSSISWAEDVC